MKKKPTVKEIKAEIKTLKRIVLNQKLQASLTNCPKIRQQSYEIAERTETRIEALAWAIGIN